MSFLSWVTGLERLILRRFRDAGNRTLVAA
jgi:hypothetical protein